MNDAIAQELCRQQCTDRTAPCTSPDRHAGDANAMYEALSAAGYFDADWEF